jgi:ABC-type antimicrobial peptide transport system permease subunit
MTVPAPRRSVVDVKPVRDVGVAVAVGFVQLTATLLAVRHEGQPDRLPLDALAVALLLAGPLALTLRRRFPLAVLQVAFLSTLAYVVIGYRLGPVWLGLIVAFVNAVRAGPRWAAWATLGLGWVSFLWLGHWLGRDRAPSGEEMLALAGIANTLALSVHERTRELGLLRAVGQTRRQVRAMLRREAVVVALFGTLGGVALGVFGGWALVGAAGADVARLTIPAGRLAAVVGAGAVAGVLAGVRPARRAARRRLTTSSLPARATGRSRCGTPCWRGSR